MLKQVLHRDADWLELFMSPTHHPWALISILLACTTGCQLLNYFEQAPPDRCEVPGRQEQLPCGPCLKGLQLRACSDNFLWHREGACLDNPYDVDQDGYANDLCLDEEDDTCCGEPDCDDTTAERYPGHGDVDRDEHIDARCGGDDCDDDNDDLWNGHADRDDDGHDDVRCGGDDCDDFSDERWNGHADVDGDGHTDLRCCADDTPLCDDCNDDDPERWLNHADLDWDGRDDMSCCNADGLCGDDCDDEHPLRWLGHADVDGDGRVDDRCCPECAPERLDCNDNDPRRWTGWSDLDGDGHHDARCRCDDVASTIDCGLFDDCDDDCETCFPGAEVGALGARDHDCDAVVDELQDPACALPYDLEVVGTVDTGDSLSVFAVDHMVYVGSREGLFAVDVFHRSSPLVLSHLDLGEVRDVAVWGDLVLAATALGLYVVLATDPSELVLLHGPLETGDTRGVFAVNGLAYTASNEGVFIVDLDAPPRPVVTELLGEPFLRDARDIFVHVTSLSGIWITVTTGPSEQLSEGGIVHFTNDDCACDTYFDVDLPGAERLDMSCRDTFFVSSSDGVAGLRASGSLRLTSTGIDSADTRSVAALCDRDERHILFVGGPDVIRVLSGFEPMGMTFHDDVATGTPSDVAVLDDEAFVATRDGLVVVSLGCER